MKKTVATRIDNADKEKFKAISDKYHMSESVVLRLLVLALNKNDKKLMPVIMKILDSGKKPKNLSS